MLQLKPVLAYSLSAFDYEMRLWKQSNPDNWGAVLGCRGGKQVYYLYFEAGDDRLAKLQVCSTARALAVLQKDADIPPGEAFLDSWRPLTTQRVSVNSVANKTAGERAKIVA